MDVHGPGGAARRRRPGPTASCAPARTRSRAARRRSSRTSSPSASWGCRADELRPLRRPADIKRTAREFLAARYPLGRGAAARARGRARLHRRAVGRDGRARLAGARPSLGTVELIVLAEELGYAARAHAAALHLGGAAAARGGGRGRAAFRRAARRGRAVGAGQRAPDAPALAWEDGALSGVKVAVPDAAAADLLVVTAPAGGTSWWRRGRRGCRSRDRSRSTPRAGCYEVRFDGTPGEELPRRTGTRAWLAITVANAAESVGVGQRAMEMAVAYAKERTQFDRPIGSYQAVSHAVRADAARGRGRAGGRLLGGLGARPRAGDGAGGRLDGQGVRGRRRPARARRGAPGARRHRLHLGARPALLPQARRTRTRGCTATRPGTGAAWRRCRCSALLAPALLSRGGSAPPRAPSPDRTRSGRRRRRTA